MKANLRYRIGSALQETALFSIVPMTSDAIETGPTARCLELPRIEYINGGTKLESANRPKSIKTQNQRKAKEMYVINQ